jgi:hypothetical protein
MTLFEARMRRGERVRASTVLFNLELRYERRFELLSRTEALAR